MTTFPMPTLGQRYRGLIERHPLMWELGMGAFAVVYVAIPFLAEGPLASAEGTLAIVEALLTALFLAEFFSRLAVSEDRLAHLSRHWIDAVALIPVVRGLRITRLLGLGRLVRTFAGVQRASTGVHRVAPYQTLFNLVAAWFAVMIVSAVSFFGAESGVNPGVRDGWDALWWSITTFTGGPAEINAVTEEGRIATAVLLLLGVALFAAITASLINLVAGQGDNQHVRSRLGQLLELCDAGELNQDAFDDRLRRLASVEVAGVLAPAPRSLPGVSSSGEGFGG
jgi:hypothetical protein